MEIHNPGWRPVSLLISSVDALHAWRLCFCFMRLITVLADDGRVSLAIVSSMEHLLKET